MIASIKQLDIGEVQLIGSIDFYGNRDYCVYAHIFPDGKKYIGATKNISKRWKLGEGYVSNKEMHRAIQKYGWGNIRHEIVADNLSISQAREIERNLIKLFNSVNDGYNKANGGDGLFGYLNKYGSTIIKFMEQHTPIFDDHLALLREIDGCEEESERINNADYQMRMKWKEEYDSFKHGDSLLFLAYWWQNLVFILGGGKIDDIGHFGSVAAERLNEIAKENSGG